MSVGEKEAIDKDPQEGGGAEAASEAPGAAPGEASADAVPTGGAAEPEPSPEQLEIASLRARLEELQASSEQSMARLRMVSKAYKDLQDEMKSFKERMEHRAKLDSELQAFDQVRAFFDPVMNLKRSIAAPEIDAHALHQGVIMIQQQFMEALQRLGLEEVPGVGAKFDPNVHEALGITPVTDPDQDGVVLMVHTVGYSVRGKVLQAAQVLIGKYEGAAGEA